MLPLPHKIAFLLFALLTGALGLWGFYRLYLRIRRGRPDADLRTDRIAARLWYALITTITQSRTFKKRPAISFFHSFIFYGFSFYILVNIIDGLEGYAQFSIPSNNILGAAYNLFADVLSFLVLVGVIALVIRRFLLPSRRDFRFNAKTLLHSDIPRGSITRDSLIVSSFILFHVGSRALGAGAKLAVEGPDAFQPFATTLSYLFTSANAESWRIFGYWGALGSVLAFFAYFPYTKHVHIFMAPAKYFFAREPNSGTLPAVKLDLETETPEIGAAKLEDLGWPRLLDAYACIQCNRCQDVCPATATGKSLSPAALEINKRLELNQIAAGQGIFFAKTPGFESGAASPRPLFDFALSPEAAWACTTCGACMEVCPVQDEQMLDIIDIRRNQVMIEGQFPTQLQTAFRGMERARNPWGINHEQRLAWAEGLNVKTIDDNPEPDVLYWVGCAASYDPQAQKTARAFVQLLQQAQVNFAVLGKKECCTGDSARRAGNEYLYRQLADQNVTTLSAVKPKLIVATCPHCLNTIGNEYKQIGGDYKVMHHTEYLASLVSSGKLDAKRLDASITYHDPCYLGRHNGVYDAPRNVLRVLGNELLELERTRANSFCCGAGGAQFWKEEEEGNERISDNRFREVTNTLQSARSEKVLAVGCPFCKSMLNSTPNRNAADDIVVKDVAELLLESVLGNQIPEPVGAAPQIQAAPEPAPAPAAVIAEPSVPTIEQPQPQPQTERKKWQPKAAVPTPASEPPPAPTAPPAERKKWTPKSAAPSVPLTAETTSSPSEAQPAAPEEPKLERKKWQPKSKPE